MRPTVPAIALGLALLSPGCLAFEVAHVPDALLQNGWRKDGGSTDAGPSGSSLGTRTQRVGYRDAADDDRGYPGQLVVSTIRTLFTPTDDALLAAVQEQVKSSVEQQKVRLDDAGREGSRALANGATSKYFVYSGTATSSSSFFEHDSKLKIMGEVFQCRGERTAVYAVALAQVTTTRSVGGVTFPDENDPTTWRELVADPSGSVEGHRGSGGLLHNVACS